MNITVIKIMSNQLKEQRLSRWYFGGAASAGAAMCTHPLDLLKVSEAL